MVKEQSRRRFLGLAAAGATSVGISSVASRKTQAVSTVGGESVVGQTDTIVARQVSDQWERVSFEAPFELTPIVIMQPVSAHDSAPVSVHLRKVTRRGFEFRLEAWESHDGEYTPEQFSYLAVARGVYELSGSLVNAEAGFVAADASPQSVSFDHSFTRRPVVLAQTQTNGRHGDAAVGSSAVTRVAVTGPNQFTVRLQQQEQYRSETVGYLAFELGAGVLDPPIDALDQRLGRFEVESTTQSVTDGWHSITFEHTYDQPIFLSGLQTLAGHDTATTRVEKLHSEGVAIRIEEDRSHDRELIHVPERVGYAVFENEQLLYVSPR